MLVPWLFRGSLLACVRVYSFISKKVTDFDVVVGTPCPLHLKMLFTRFVSTMAANMVAIFKIPTDHDCQYLSGMYCIQSS